MIRNEWFGPNNEVEEALRIVRIGQRVALAMFFSLLAVLMINGLRVGAVREAHEEAEALYASAVQDFVRLDAASTTTTLSHEQVVLNDQEARAENAQALLTLRQAQEPVETVLVIATTTTTTTTLPPTTTTTTQPHPCDLVQNPGPIFLSQRTLDICPDISPWFDPWDLLHALLVVECESNGDPYANDHWQDDGRSKYPLGVWSHINWYYEERSMKFLGFVIDPYDVREASMLAARLVYEDSRGWGHWQSCHQKDNYAISRTLRNAQK